ncbi:MAG: oligopeptide transporter, OPT family [Deltaproteobacteria bacterium]|nr:oligopeptide transporter, OPT family [Deltaproteobacteria bacterium]
METGQSKRTLPENAYRKLAGGEVYRSVVAPDDRRAEVTPWAVGMALLLVFIFSAACIYMALRAGSGIEAAIPIAILAIFFGKARQAKSTILENVIVQSIGQASGVVAAGAAFTIPALYINGLQPVWWQIFLACVVGGVLGTVLIIPLRRYFVAERHGDLPFPEATATTEILVAGESTGKTSGRVLLISFGLGALYDFLVEAVHAWNPNISTKALFGTLGEKMYAVRSEIKINALAALFGLGYIVGVRYAAIIAAGSVLAYAVLVPLIYVVGAQVTDLELYGRHVNVAAMSAAEIFNTFVKPVSIGAIAVSGLIGIIRMSKIIVHSVTLGFKGLSKAGVDAVVRLRTDTDMKPRTVVLIQLAAALAMAVLFFIVTVSYVGPAGQGYSGGQSLLFATVGAVVGFGLAFLFTPVAAEAIAIVGTNPVSGMTMITLILASLVLTALGLSGDAGIFIAIVVGCAVCTALSTAGALISDFKIGYWIGSTPAQQQRWKFLGIAVASLTCAFVVPLMDSSYHFLVHVNPLDLTSPLTSNTDVLPAPQANMLAAIVRGMMTAGGQPYLLYALGGLVAFMLYMAGVPPLAFSLGMYLPISITLAQLLGAVVSFVVGKTGGDEEVRKVRSEQGVLIASGMMAGAAIIGIVTAILRLDWTGYLIRYISIGVDYVVQQGPTGSFLSEAPRDAALGPTWYEGFTGQGLGFLMYVVLAVLVFVLAAWGAAAELKERGRPQKS